MKTTIFNTPLISTAFHCFFRFALRTFGWCVQKQMPEIPKFVLIGATHTSN